MIITEELRHGRYERARLRRERRLLAYRQSHPESPPRARYFPHDPFSPRLMPGPTRDRESNTKLLSWQIDAIKAVAAWYFNRPDEFRHYTIGRGKGKTKLQRSRCRSEKAELMVRVLILMITHAQCGAGSNFERYEVGSYRNGRLWRWKVQEIGEKTGEGPEQPSADQLGDIFNALGAIGWSWRRQESENSPATWKITRELLSVLRISKRFHASEGLDPDLEYYLRQVHGENPELHRTDEGRTRALQMAARRLRDAQREGKARPPPA